MDQDFPADTPSGDVAPRRVAKDLLIGDLTGRLRASGSVFAEDEAALLAASTTDAAELERRVRRREGGEPLEVVLGWTMFCGLRVAVDPGVFVPRVRTELLAETAAALTRPGSRVVDLCCGTGAVALVVATAQPLAHVYAADVDPAAVANARRTLAPVGATVREGDLFGALPGTLLGRVDVLAVNAPYVPTEAIARMPREARLYEHRVALDGGPDGLVVHRRVAAGASSWLATGGTVLLEASAAQAPITAGLLTDAGLTAEVLRDEDRDATVVLGRGR